MSWLTIREKTLFEELWEIIIKKYFTVDFGVYENINIDYDSAISPAVIVLAVFVAAVAATSAMIFNKGTLGRLIRRLISRGGVGFENAKTLEELGLDKSLAIKLFINRYTLQRYVRCREEDEFYGIDPSKCDEEISSIGIENNEVIKVPFWRRKADAKMRANACDTTNTEENYCAASNDSLASHVIENECDATQKNEQKNACCGEVSAEDIEVAENEYEDAYAASLMEEKKYKRQPTDHFYVRPSQKHRLLVRFDKKGTNPIWIFIVGSICIVGGVLVIKALPWILDTLDGLLGTFNTTK